MRFTPPRFFLLLCILSFILLLLLVSGCTRISSDTGTIFVAAHAELWNTPFFTFPVVYENATTFLAIPNSIDKENSDFVGFRLGLIGAGKKAVSCEVNEFYDGRQTYNFSMRLSPAEEYPGSVVSILSQGFRLQRIKPEIIRYNFTCTRKQGIPFKSEYLIFVEYPFSS